MYVIIMRKFDFFFLEYQYYVRSKVLKIYNHAKQVLSDYFSSICPETILVKYIYEVGNANNLLSLLPLICARNIIEQCLHLCDKGWVCIII